MKKIAVIGSGFAGLTSAIELASLGYKVTVFEKKSTPGGRARKFETNGFTFDMGPSWYWMPDVFERFFADFGKKPSDYYTLDKLHPGYEVYFGENSSLKISSHLKEIYDLFEKEEKGSAKHLQSFIKSAKSNYETAIKALVYKQLINLERWLSSQEELDFSDVYRMQINRYFDRPNDYIPPSVSRLPDGSPIGSFSCDF